MSEEKNVNAEQTEVKPEKKERKNKKDEEIQKLMKGEINYEAVQKKINRGYSSWFIHLSFKL